MLQHIQGWLQYYGNLPGVRVRIKSRGDALSEVFWLLGQEHDHLVLGQEPEAERSAGRRRLTLLDTDSIDQFELLEEHDPLAERLPHEATATLHGQVVYAHGRVSIHALTPSGSRSHTEITGLEPAHGGLFRGPNHLLGFALRHLHLELQDDGLVPPGELPFREGWRTIPATRTAILPEKVSPAATLTITILETRGDQLAGVTMPVVRIEAPRKPIATAAHVKVWGYELLCQEAARRRVLPADFAPKIRRSRLGEQ